MAIYEFRCSMCSQEKTISVSMTEIYPVPNCDNCLIIMERKWSANPIHFKGDGWGHQ
jgi:putative FmdB family regulatory protein